VCVTSCVCVLRDGLFGVLCLSLSRVCLGLFGVLCLSLSRVCLGLFGVLCLSLSRVCLGLFGVVCLSLLAAPECCRSVRYHLSYVCL